MSSSHVRNTHMPLTKRADRRRPSLSVRLAVATGRPCPVDEQSVLLSGFGNVHLWWRSKSHLDPIAALSEVGCTIRPPGTSRSPCSRAYPVF